MTKGFKKKQSKRISSKQMRKVDKKVKEHNRKKKREAKKNPTKGKRSKKDPGIPNSLPFKDEILAEIAEKKRRDFEKKKQRKLEKKSKAKKRTLEGMVKDADKRNAEFEVKEIIAGDQSELQGLYDNSLKAFYKEVKKVIEAADVVLEILDARDPLGTRCRALEDAVLQSGPNKRLVLLLNKCDLIPKENLVAWLKFLRQEFPTIPFKASTQSQKLNLSHCRVPVHLAEPSLIKTTKCFGANILMKILGNYCRNKGISTAIRVGIVGLPNVGKSSVINSLKRKQSCNVGSTPGVTKTMQEVNLDKHVTLLDSPGILFAKEGNDHMAVLRNAIRIETIQDPVEPVDVILKKCSKTLLMLKYKVEDFSSTAHFLALVAAKRGLLKKGGIPDVTKAARIILQDWVSGKISFFTTPPENREDSVHLNAQLVSNMSKEFDLEAVENEEQMVIDDMPQSDPITSSSIDDLEAASEESSSKTKETDTESNMIVNIAVGKEKTADSEDEWMDEPDQTLEGNQQWQKVTKSILKRRKRLKTKRDKTASKMADDMDAILSLGKTIRMEE